METRPVTILCLASYEKGADFLCACRELGCRTLLLTVDTLKDAPWPWDAVDRFHHMPELYHRQNVTNAVSWLARTDRIDRIIALDEFDLEMAAALREHLRVAGMGETAVRYFRDKLAMRQKARAGGVLVPEFTPVFTHETLARFLDKVPAPWLVKPRTEASAVGIRKLDRAEEVWRTVEELGDRQSHHLVERYIPGDVYHVDSIVSAGRVVFAEVHRYARPPFDVMHGGGLFCTRTLPRGSADETALKEINARIVSALGFARGVLHTEFIRGEEDGRTYFLETAARVGGANIVETVEAATGVNLWHEWARLEVANARRETYAPPAPRTDYAGVVISLARQEWPDTSAYDDPEIVWRMSKLHHAGLVVASPDTRRIDALLENYMARFYDEFHASLPAPDRPTA
ncbi:MAG: ATP-grasp domain-containing protein, partial [Longimicrobiales bacterium]